MEKKNKRNNHMMNKGMKQKVSVLLILCLLLTGYRGLTISGKAEQGEKKESNEISVSGTEVKVQLHGEDLRKAAKEAIEKGDKVEENFLKGYSADGELQKEYEAVFSPEKEVYEIPLDSISEGLSESLSEEEAGLQIFVERDAKDLESLVRRESKESLLLYDGNSQISKLFPEGKNEEKQNVEKAKKNGEKEETTVSEEGSLASDSNIKRNTELTGSELITFLYKNKSDHKISFKLSVDGNQYPKIAVAPKTQLFKALVEKLKQEEKKAQAEVKPAEKQEEKSIEKQEEKTKEEVVKAETSEEQKEISKETASVEEEKELSEKEDKPASEVSIVSTDGKTEETQAEEEKAEKNKEKKEENKVETAEAETKEESAEKSEEAEKDGAKLTEVKKDSTKPAEAEKEVPETEKQSGEGKEAKEKAGVTGFLGEVLEHYEEFQGELVSARFTQYSLNELGRKSQNVEIEGFATVEVFYDDEAFTDADGKVEEVVLEAKRLFKPEEEAEGEKLSEEQVKVLKEHSIYDDGASLDIRFVDKHDPSVEVEPLSPVGVRITLEKKALPETVSPDTISIHHLVENDETKEIEKVDTVVQANASKKLIVNDDVTYNSEDEKELENSKSTLKTNNADSDEEVKKETITKEFMVDSFSLYQIHWDDRVMRNCPPIRFHYVDKNFNEIGPTVRVDESLPLDISLVRAETSTIGKGRNKKFIYKHTDGNWYYYTDELQVWHSVPKTPQHVFYDKASKSGEALKKFNGYDFLEVYPYKPGADNLDEIVNGKTDDYFDINYKYSPGNSWKPDEEKKEFGKGMDGINSAGYYSPQFPGILSPWYSKDFNKTDYCYAQSFDFYFVYDINPKEAKKRTIEDVESKQDKYIKDNQDGTYDLTLSAQVRKNCKPENLDIVFLVDTTKTMDASFDTKNEKSRREAVQDYLSEMVTSLSKNSNYNLRFGLVGFGGGKTDDGTTISDTAFNDVTYIGGFTDSASDFKTMLAKLPKSEGSQTGPNYTAAIMGARRLLDGSFGPTADGKPSNFAGGIDRNVSDIAREDANKIIVLITDNDPVYSYVLEDGVYDETRKTSGELKSFTATLQKGYSYGNGVDFSRVALNQARGFLSNFSKPYTAFYTIGIGNKDNWKHLEELSVAHGYDQRDDWRRIKYKNGDLKFIRAKSAVQKNADTKNFDGSTPELLKSSFAELGKKIAPSATELTITDTLSENVTFVKDKKLRAEVFKMKANGIDTDGKALTEPQLKELGLNGFKLEEPNPTLQQGGDIKLTTNPADFALPAGYEIRLTATIKPSPTGYKKLRNNQAKDEGGDRTDLQDIYRKEKITLPSDYSDVAVYGTSAGKKGLFTNDKAEFTYKWKGQDKRKEYPKPIIKVNRADLKIEKTFVGLDKKLVNNSSGVTEFGKKIVQQLKFEILRSENKLGTHQAESLLIINFEDELWAKALDGSEVSQNGKKETVTIDGEDHEVTIRLINEANGEPKLSITVKGLDSEKYEYEVWEYINGFENGKAKAVSDPDNLQGPKYRWIDGVVHDGPKIIDNTACGIFTFRNRYQKEEPKQTVTIEKIVNEFGGLSQQAKNDVFDFYMALYNGTEAYDETKTKNFFSNLSSETRGNTLGTTEIKVKEADGSIKNQWVIHFQLTHEHSLSLTMDPNVYFSLFELKKEKYGKAIVTGKWSGQEHDFTEPSLMEIDASTKYSYTNVLSNRGQTITFKNPRITLVPTGLRGDITPYLFSILGFTMMAGVYLTIKKKKRIEI